VTDVVDDLPVWAQVTGIVIPVIPISVVVAGAVSEVGSTLVLGPYHVVHGLYKRIRGERVETGGINTWEDTNEPASTHGSVTEHDDP
jgi:hypothetical protein